jgi:hypothetical protein
MTITESWVKQGCGYAFKFFSHVIRRVLLMVLIIMKFCLLAVAFASLSGLWVLFEFNKFKGCVLLMHGYTFIFQFAEDSG